MTVYFRIPAADGFLRDEHVAPSAAHLTAVTTQPPEAPETPPNPYLCLAGNASALNVINLDAPEGRAAMAALMHEAPIYRITLELLVDRILLESRKDPARAKGVRIAFAPDDAPELVADPMGEKYAFAGTLHFPVIASRTDGQLLDLYLRLYGAACPEHDSVPAHLAAILGVHPGRLADAHDGLLWRGAGWVRLDRLVYEAERMDHDPAITFESYVTRGRAAAETLAVADPEALLAAWIGAERVQRELARDIDVALRLPDIRRLPRWVRADVFRILEREAMKQVFAESIVNTFGEWPGLRRARSLAEPIEANAKGEVAPLIQQLLNQTLSADARYSGAAEAFVIQAERRWADARALLGQR